MTGGSDIQLRVVAFLPWGDRLAPVVGVIEPAPGSGALEVPGRVSLPSRTWLETAPGPSGLAGRIIDPDGRARPLAVRLDAAAPAFIELPARPLALAPRSDGVWSMDASTLVSISAAGLVGPRVPLEGTRLVGAEDDAVWVLALDRCWLVAADGSLVVEAPWSDPFNACLVGDRLCGWDPDDAGGVVLLHSGGGLERRRLATRRGHFERPLWFGEHAATGAVLSTLIRHGDDGDAALVMTGAGMAADGTPFLSGLCDGRSWLWRRGEPVGEPRGGGDGQVLAVSGDHVLSWTGDGAAWTAGERMTPGTQGPDQLVSVAWLVEAPFPFAMAADGEVLLAASGPTGVAVLGLRWPPIGVT